MARLHLLLVGLAVLLYNLSASVVAWLVRWPAQFGGNPDPDQGYLSYLFGGSAISAPLPPLIALFIGLLLSRRQDAWQTLGLVMVAIVSVVFMVFDAGTVLILMGILGEGFAGDPNVPRAALFLFGVGHALIAATLLFLVMRAWRRPA